MKANKLALATSVALAASLISSQALANISGISLSGIINLGYTEREDFSGVAKYGVDEHAAGLKQGFWTDHSELTLSAPIDDLFFGKISIALDEHEGSIELELEEAFIQATQLPYDLSFRAGRFLSNVGYLNGKHTHTDSFSDRPLLYRTFMNGHYYDDGLRLAWLAPTDVYLELGTELFKGGQGPASASGDGIGSYSFFAKMGGDFSLSHSWQIGVSGLSFDNDEGQCTSHNHSEQAAEHDAEHHDDEHDEHEQAFSPCDFSGSKDYYMIDGVWKWAPDGNYKYQNFALSMEYFLVKEQGELAIEQEHEHQEIPHTDAVDHQQLDVDHSGFYVSGVYQFTPNWAAGIRYSQVKLAQPFSDNFNPNVSSVMVQWQNSHSSTLRLQFNQDNSTKLITDNQISLQFIMALGAHGAHQF